MKAAFLIAGAAVAAAATPASAQDAGTGDFTGPRIEARVGYEFTSAGIRDVRTFDNRGTFGGSPSGEQVTAGAEVGYDMQLGGIVVGAYAGVDFSDVSIRSPRQPLTFEAGRNFTAGVRAGVALQANVLLYAKGGYSNGRLNVEFQPGANQAPFANFDRDRSGYHLGGGVEIPVLTNFYVRADYTHTRYERFNYDANNEIRFSRHQLLGGIGVRF